MRFDPNIKFDTTARPKAWNFIDRTGHKFGRLTVLRFAGRKSKQSYWFCRCECGTEFATYIGNVVRGLTRSCGCLHSEHSSAAATTHGETRQLSKTPEYACWVQIKTRCFNQNYVEFHLYGGRGITMCDRWRDSFENFLADMGRRPSRKHSIDREDVNGHYEPGNCRWATSSDQAKNRRHSPRARDAEGKFKSKEMPA